VHSSGPVANVEGLLTTPDRSLVYQASLDGTAARDETHFYNRQFVRRDCPWRNAGVHQTRGTNVERIHRTIQSQLPRGGAGHVRVSKLERSP